MHDISNETWRSDICTCLTYEVALMAGSNPVDCAVALHMRNFYVVTVMGPKQVQ